MEENKELSFVDKLKAPVGTLWQNHKIFLIGFGILILIIKFQDVIIDVLVGNSKRLVDNAEKKSSQLQSEENQAKAQADKLVQEAKDLSENKPKVGEDWHKK